MQAGGRGGPSTVDSSVLSSGSRHDHLVAAVCGVGVASVHAARRAAAAGCSRSPAKRGRVRQQRAADTQPDCLDVPASGYAPCHADGDRRGDPGVPATGTVKHGVAAQLSSSAAVPTPGTFDEEKRVALVLGRLYLHAAVTNLPDYRVRAILVQFLLAGVPIGQRLHSEQAIHHFTGIAAKAL